MNEFRVFLRALVDRARRARIPRTLTVQAVVVLLSALFVTVAIAYTVVSPLFARTLHRELAKRGEAMAAILEQHQEVRLVLSLSDTGSAQRLAERLVRQDPDIQYLALVAPDGKWLGKAGGGGVEESELKRLLEVHGRADAAETGILKFTQPVRRHADARAGELDFATDAAAARGELGTVWLGLSERSVRGQLSVQTLLTILLTGTVLLVAFVLFFARIAARLNKMAAFAAQLAAGDLGATLDEAGRDEIGRLGASLREMTERTGRMVAQLQEASIALTDASTEILASSSNQGRSVALQADSVSETGETVAELRIRFKQAAERAQSVISLAQRSEESTLAGRQAVEECLTAMAMMREQVLAISRAMSELGNQTTQVNSIIESVNDLAEQSNVLALNAAIEAIKAGEHGKGFAVVAREVRSLAQRSKQSTSEVRMILGEIEKVSRQAVKVIEGGTKQANAGMQLAERAGESIASLNRAIAESSAAAQEIAATTRQQSEGVEQISIAMREINRAVSEGASGIEQLATASKNMKAISEQMRELVSRYQVGGARPSRTH